MPTITDWLMVIITFVYVVATIFICIANLKSAKASKAQLEEMKKEFEDDNRPYIDIEFVFERRTWFIVRFINRGKQSAIHTRIVLDDDFINSLPESAVRTQLIQQKNKECIIGAGQHYDLFIGSTAIRNQPNIKPVSGTVSYEAKGKTYANDIFVDLENYMTIFSSQTEHEDLIKALNTIDADLKMLTNTISKKQ